MSTNDVLSKLKAEMERRMHICDGIFERESDTYYQGKAVAYQETLSFLDTLKQEQPSEDLEVEMGKYFDGWHDDPEYGQAVLPHTYECVGVSDCKDIARHFYELGKQSKEFVSEELEAEIKRYRKEEMPVVLESDLNDIARHFAEWQKEQVLKDAVEGEVYRYESYQRIATAILVDIPRENLGDKVKVVIIPIKEGKE